MVDEFKNCFISEKTLTQVNINHNFSKEFKDFEENSWNCEMSF